MSTSKLAGLVEATLGLYRNTMLNASTYSCANDSRKICSPASLPNVGLQVSIHACIYVGGDIRGGSACIYVVIVLKTYPTP